MVALTGTAILLIVVGVSTVLLDMGSSGAVPTVSLPTVTTATPSLLIATTGSPSPIASVPTGSLVPDSQPPLVPPSPFVSPPPSRNPAGFALTQTGLAYLADDGTVVPVSAVAGLRVDATGGKAVYSALAGNRYGLKTGAYAGEFKPNVTMQQADGSSTQTGGIVAVGAVASRLILDRLAPIKAGTDRWIVALPVDVRTEPAASTVSVAFDNLGFHGLSDTPRVVVRFDGAMPVTNSIPTNGGFHVLVEGLNVTAWQVVDPTRFGLPVDKIDSNHPMNELIVYGSGAPSLTRDFYFDGRVVVGQKMLSASGDISVSLAVQSSHADLGPDQILTLGGVPVFVASS